MITAVCVCICGVMHFSILAVLLLPFCQWASKMTVTLVSLPVSRGFQTKSLDEIGRRKKYSSLIQYGKHQVATGEILTREVKSNSWWKQITGARKTLLSTCLNFINWNSLYASITMWQKTTHCMRFTQDGHVRWRLLKSSVRARKHEKCSQGMYFC